MYIRIGYEFQFDLPCATHLVLMLHTHPEKAHLLQRPERIHVEPDELRLSTFADAQGNRASRLIAPAGKLRVWYDNVIWDSGQREPGIADLPVHLVDELPHEALPFLMGSRWCEVDRLGPMAWDLFGKIPRNDRVAAVMDWVHANVRFGYKFARMNKTAWDTWYERTGVCRDFQHLTISLLRALNIPARYATGYLGDIEVPSDGLPDDFSAWIEVFMGGQWVTLDARHNIPRVGRILMARGRDATDVALTTSFGPARLERFKVWTEEVGAEAVGQADAVFVPAAVTVPPTPAPMPVAA